MKYRHLWLAPLLFFSIYLVGFAWWLGNGLRDTLVTGLGIALPMALINWMGWRAAEKKKANELKLKK